jgi:hypothetical protein
MVQLPLAGGCMCGALRYEVSAPPLMIYNCHCTNCQKIGGTAFNTSVIVTEAVAALHSGRACACRVGVGQRLDAVGLFCGKCGSRIVNGGKPSTGVFSLRARHAGRHQLGAARGRHLHAQRSNPGSSS